MKRVFKTILTIAAIFLFGPAFAGENPMKPGLWEITTNLSMPGMPHQIPPTKSTHCYTSEEIARQGVVPEQQGDCSMTELNQSGNKVTWKVVCQGDSPGKGKGEIVFENSNSYQGKMQFESQGMTISSAYSGKWVGECQ